MQKFTQTLKFANNVKGFAETSQNLVFQNKADRLKSSEYCRVNSSKANEERYVGHVEILNVGIQGQNMAATATPSRVLEHRAISEYFLLLNATIEIPGRKYEHAKGLEHLKIGDNRTER